MEYRHIPVMLNEILEYIKLDKGDLVADCTLGGAGYTVALAKKVGEKGKVVAIDLDPLAIDNAKKRLEEEKIDNVILVLDNFKNLKKVVEEKLGKKLKAIVMDLGLSSAQLDDESRGFSFQGSRYLDMSFGGHSQKTIEIINTYPLLELTRIFREYGEEKKAYYIAKTIVEKRKKHRIDNTKELVDIIEESVFYNPRKKIHPATKVFQALRIETNSELDNLKQILNDASSILEKGGRIAIVSFHSGEDRIVKWFFRKNEGWKIITKKPIIPSDQEINNNSKARSAKLRVAEKI